MPADPSPTDLHARVTATILQQLDTADADAWTPPWHGTDPLPRNALTGKRYRGLNILALWCAARGHGYTDARWATYRQWAALGAPHPRPSRSRISSKPAERRPSDARSPTASCAAG